MPGLPLHPFQPGFNSNDSGASIMLSKQLFIIISIIIYQSFVGYLGLGWLWMDGWQLSGVRRKGFMLKGGYRKIFLFFHKSRWA